MQFKTIITCCFFLFAFDEIQAQDNTVATGGEATGTGGKASYSAGQIVYKTKTGSNGKISEGLQQAYIVSTTFGIKELSIKLKMTAYPNPTKGPLNLFIDETDNLTYQLIDFQGKIIESQKIISKSTAIDMEELSNAIYFLHVSNKEGLLKTFKIIKN